MLTNHLYKTETKPAKEAIDKVRDKRRVWEEAASMIRKVLHKEAKL